jgi:transcriptional regulator with XRE-family HTH domain
MQANWRVSHFLATVVAMGDRAINAGGPLAAALGEVIAERITAGGGDGHPGSQAALARAIGVSDDTMSRWIRGERSMSVEYLYAVARALGCSGADLAREAEARRDVRAAAGGDELASQRAKRERKSTRGTVVAAVALDGKRKPPAEDPVLEP